MKHPTITFIFAFITHLAISERDFRKCCESNEGLHQDEETNSTFFSCKEFDNSTTILPLQGRGHGLKVGIPNNCSDLDTCVDKSTNGTVLKLRCDTEVKSSIAGVRKVHKCCPVSMTYNFTRKACDGDDMSRVPHGESPGFTDVLVGFPQCKGAIVDILTTSAVKPVNGIAKVFDLLSNSTQAYLVEDSCLDPTRRRPEVAIRACKDMNETCSRMGCVSKCCPVGSVYVGNTCTPYWKDAFQPEFYEDDEEDSNDHFAVVPHAGCPQGKYLLNKSRVLFRNGTLRFENEVHHVHKQEYCMEKLLDRKMKKATKNNYDVLVCFPKQKEMKHKFVYYYAGLIISCVFLSATLLVYMLQCNAQNTHGKTVMCHVSCLLAAFISLSLVQTERTNFSTLSCTIVGFTIMFTFFASFSWLNVMCFDIWWTFGAMRPRGMRKKKDTKFLLYCLYAFGLPFILTGITMTAEYTDIVSEAFKPKIGQVYCWFRDDKPYAHGLFFVLPIALLTFCNLVLFGLSAHYCYKVKSNLFKIQDTQTRKVFIADKQTLVTTLKLFLVMGVTWIFEIISIYIHEPEIIWNILDGVNALQGLWIFLIFVVKPRIWKTFRSWVLQKLGFAVVREQASGTTSMSTCKTNSMTNSYKMKNAVHGSEDGELMESRKRSG